MKKILFLLALICVFARLDAQTIYYVKIATGNDAASGSSWSNAFRNVTKALAAANASSAAEVQIWIADGTYTPEDGISVLPTDHRDTSFAFYRGSGIGRALKVYGGFAGTESSIAARDTSHHTILDGIISAGNSFHVAVIAGLSSASDSVVLDGLTFSNGLAGASSAKNYNGIPVYGYYGGGLVIIGDTTSKIKVHNCIFTLNKSVGYTIGYPYYTGSNAYGGGAYISSACLLDTCFFTANNAEGKINSTGGNAYGGGLYVYNDAVIVNRCVFTNNLAAGGTGSTSGGGYGGNAYGGAICFEQTNTSLTLNCKFFLNYVAVGEGGHNGYAYGGAVCNYVSATHAVKCLYENNISSDDRNLLGSFTFYGYGDCRGGGVANLFSAAYFDSCVFNANRAVNYSYYGFVCGGGIYNANSNNTFTACTFKNNVSDNGLAVFNDSTIALFRNCTIDTNVFLGGTANRAGGTVYSQAGSDVIFRHCSISNNGSGGVSNYRSNLSLLSCNINSNAGSGLFFTASSPNVDSCIFDRDSSIYGGAVCANDSFFSPHNCTFSNNIASSEGGAIYGGNVYYYPSSFVNNARFSSNGNIFLNNRAGSGGAIRINTCPTCADTLLNNIFIGNKGGDGGAVLVGGSRNYIYNNTFLYDSAIGSGGAIRIDGTGGLTKVANNIFFKSGASGTSPDTSIAGTGSFTFFNNIYTGTNPLFVDSLNLKGPDNIWRTHDDGIALKPCSPAVNAGNNAYVIAGENSDITGQQRILSGIVDIGAYETTTIGLIAGASFLCAGSSTTFTDTTAGGTWTSSDAVVATVSSAGLVTGLSEGLATITYSHTSTCGTSIATKSITVERAASGITVTADSLCIGSTLAASDSVSGGVWSVTNTLLATINASGIVTALSAGIDTVKYTVSNSCGISAAAKRIIVQRQAAVPGGAAAICMGGTLAYTDTVSGGVWSVTNTLLATITAGGMLHGITIGYDTIIYTITNTCGTSAASLIVEVQRSAVAITSVSDSFCITAGGIAPFDSVSGGTWSVTNPVVLNLIDTVTGVFIVSAVGIDTLHYTVTNACGTSAVSKKITVVGPGAGVVYGLSNLCVGDTATLHDTVASGGSWSTGSAGVATVNTTGRVLALGAGTANITYTVTNACGSYDYVYSITVSTAPLPAAITGTDTICQGNFATLNSSVAGGVWSSVFGNASVTGGIITGVTPGIDTIKYLLTNTCGSATTSFVIHVYSTAHCDTALAVAAVPAMAAVFSVYPNPATSQLSVKLESPINENATVTLTSIVGEKVKEWTIVTNKTVQSNIDLAPGVYILTATTTNAKYVKRVVVE